MRLPRPTPALLRATALAFIGHWSLSIGHCEASAAQPPPLRPNILFIFTDDHRADLIGAQNSAIRTPSIDQLTKSGITFERAFATTAICSPARAAVLSGLYGTRNGVATLSLPLRYPDATIAHALSKNGYRTAVFGKWHIKTSPSQSGFKDAATIGGNGSWFNRPIQTNIPGAPKALDGRFYETVMADTAIDWIAKHTATNRAEPFFIWWCTQVPHVDDRNLYPDVTTSRPEGYRSLYNVADMPVPGNWKDDLSTKPPYLRTSRFVRQSGASNYGGPGGYTNRAPGVRNATRGEDNVQQHQLEYNAAITATDAEIGRVLARLRDPNGDGDTSDSIEDNTWIVFMGDNGWQTGSHKFTSKVLAYEEAARVPLIIRPPSGTTPRTEKRLVLNIDLPAFFYDLAGLPVPDYVQGRSLRPLLEQPATATWRDHIYYEAVIAEPSLEAAPHDAIRTDRFKLIRTYAPTKSAAPEEPFDELYDLQADPGEVTNLAADPAFSAEKARLAQLLENSRRSIASSPAPSQ